MIAVVKVTFLRIGLGMGEEILFKWFKSLYANIFYEPLTVFFCGMSGEQFKIIMILLFIFLTIEPQACKGVKSKSLSAKYDALVTLFQTYTIVF